MTLTRDAFDGWIAEDLAKIEAALNATLAAGNVQVSDIDHVFLTGGTSFVPAVSELFRRRLDAERVVSGDQLTSIASSLGLIAGCAEPERWSAPR